MQVHREARVLRQIGFVSHFSDFVFSAKHFAFSARKKSGAWFSFQSERIGQGRENAKAYLEQHPELLDKLEGMILAKNGVARPGQAQPQAQPVATNGAPPPEEKGAKRSLPVPAKPAN